MKLMNAVRVRVRRIQKMMLMLHQCLPNATAALLLFATTMMTKQSLCRRLLLLDLHRRLPLCNLCRRLHLLLDLHRRLHLLLDPHHRLHLLLDPHHRLPLCNLCRRLHLLLDPHHRLPLCKLCRMYGLCTACLLPCRRKMVSALECSMLHRPRPRPRLWVQCRQRALVV